MIKRIIGVALVMMVTVFCIGCSDKKIDNNVKESEKASAQTEKEASKRPKIEGIHYEVEDSTLTIYGTGKMETVRTTQYPWSDLRTEIKAIIVEDGVESVSDKAFYGFDELVTLKLADSVQYIGAEAFEGCKSLEEMELSDNITKIGEYAFAGCKRIKNVKMPANLIVVNYAAFYNCTGLVSVEFCEGLEEIQDEAFYSCEALRDVSLPKSLKKIGKIAFKNCVSLSNISLPEGLTTLGSSAFAHCTSLTSICIPKTLTVLNGGTFYCSGLTEVKVSDGMPGLEAEESDFKETPVLKNENGFTTAGEILLHAENMKEIIIPSEIKLIVAGALRECTSTEKIVFPEGMILLSTNIFKNSRDDNDYVPKVIELPKSLVSISDLALKSCRGTIIFPEGSMIQNIGEGIVCDNFIIDWGVEPKDGLVIMNGTLVDGRNVNGDIIIPNEVKRIADGAFYGCENITGITLADGITEIGDYTFYKCVNLKNVTMQDCVESIGRMAFHKCSTLENVKLSKNIKSFGESAFGYCYELNEMEIPEGVTVLSTRIFERCTGLEYVVLPDSLTTIKSYAFQNTALKSIKIPKNVTYIGLAAFGYCTGLSFLELPDGLTEIEEDAFVSSGITEIWVPDSVTSVGLDAFNSLEKLTIYCNSGTYIEEYAKENNIPYCIK